MRISEIKTFIVGTTWRNWVFVSVETDEGLSGVGEATLEGKEKTVETAIHELKRRHIIGSDPFNIEDLWQRMYRNEYWRGGAVIMTAISAVEMACWDIVGKAVGQPVYRLLGGLCRDRVKAYANGWYIGARTPENFTRQARLVVEKGYQALKFDPFGFADRQISKKEKAKSIEIVAAVREGVGDDVEIFIEGHGRFDPATAIEIARSLEEFSPGWFEEPVPPENADALAKVAAQIRIPVAAGERLFTRWGVRDVLEKQAVAVLQPDLVHAGGILETKRIAGIADVYYVPIAPHNPMGPVATAATVQLDACTTNFLIQESFDEFDAPWRNQVAIGAPLIEGGYYVVPDRPGWGVELKEDAISEHPYLPDAFFNMWAEGWQDSFMPHHQ